MARSGGNRKLISSSLRVRRMVQGCRPRTSRARACTVGLAGIAVVLSAWLYTSTTRIESAAVDSWTFREEEPNSIETLDLRGRSIDSLKQEEEKEQKKEELVEEEEEEEEEEKEEEEEEQPRRGADVAGLVLIKSFKTGSTTLATYIAQIGHQREAYFLHPKATGWFARGELESRRDQGQTFDISLRHITPFTPYNVLEDLVPGAVFATIMRDPLDRFLSLFNFRGELKRRFRTPQALVAAIKAGKLPLSDARPFCNQLAWLMSGEEVDYTRVGGEEEEARRVAKAVIDEAARRNVTVLLTERMSESISVLADRMGWRVGGDVGLQLRVSSQRVQKRGDSGQESSFFYCGDDHACVSAIRSCNMVDGFLYEHYEAEFESLVRRLSSPERARILLDEMPPARSSMSRLELGVFPVNCIGSKVSSWEDVYSRLHACDGRPV